MSEFKEDDAGHPTKAQRPSEVEGKGRMKTTLCILLGYILLDIIRILSYQTSLEGPLLLNEYSPFVYAGTVLAIALTRGRPIGQFIASAAIILACFVTALQSDLGAHWRALYVILGVSALVAVAVQARTEGPRRGQVE